jgi:hypothetical protein
MSTPRSKPKNGTRVERVTRIDGEPLSFFVQSSTRLNLQHRVELDAYAGNGACGCENFEIKCRGKLENGAKKSAGLRCRHIRAARDFWCDEILQAVIRQAAIERLKRLERNQ